MKEIYNFVTSNQTFYKIMKALIYENHDEINLNYIVNLVGKIERQRI